MHLLLRERHGLDEAAAAKDLGQAAADLVVLSFSDSDLGAFAAAWRDGRDTLPSLRLANLRRLTHPLSVDLYLEKTLSGARGILIRLLGGIDYWRYGVEQLSALAAAKGIALAIIPGDGRPDPRLDAASNLPPSTLRRLKTLCDKGGPESARAALAQLALAAGLSAAPSRDGAALPRHGFYRPGTRRDRRQRARTGARRADRAGRVLSRLFGRRRHRSGRPADRRTGAARRAAGGAVRRPA